MAEPNETGEAAGTGSGFFVACLCAAWCSACRDYRAVFDALAERFAASARFAWVDIEDRADDLGDFDTDDFPTLFIARGDDVLFLGPVTPQAQTAERLVRGAIDGGLPPPSAAAAAGFAARVRSAAGISKDEIGR